MANTSYLTAEFVWTDVSDGPVTLKNQGHYPVVVIINDTQPASDGMGYVMKVGETFSYGGGSNVWVRTEKDGVKVNVMVSEEG